MNFSGWLLACMRYEDSLQHCNLQYRERVRAVAGQTWYEPLSARPWTPRYLRLRAPLRNLGSGSITLMSSSPLTSSLITKTVVTTSTDTSQENMPDQVEIQFYFSIL